jgi:hypothetical protein
MLLVLENRPPMSNSASNEKARRCRDHFLPAFLGFFSDTTAPLFLLLLLAKRKNKKMPTRAATTIGTATAALRADEHDRLLQDFWVTVTPPVALLAALVAVPVAVLDRLAVALVAPVATEVAKVVEAVEVGVAAALAAVELPAVLVEELSAVFCVAGPMPPVVREYSLAREEA